MTPLRKSAFAVVSSVAFGTLALSPVSAAHADETSSVPCANQQMQVDKANAKLTALTAKFAAHPTTKNLKAKKAQVQRVTRATTRLEACVAGTTDEPTDEPTDD
jgi:L-asparaginase II